MQPPSSIRNETPGGVEFCLCRDTHDISENVIQEMSHILKNNISLILFYGSDFFTDYDLTFEHLGFRAVGLAAGRF